MVKGLREFRKMLLTSDTRGILIYSLLKCYKIIFQFGLFKFTPRDKSICASYKFVGNFRSVGDQTSTGCSLGV